MFVEKQTGNKTEPQGTSGIRLRAREQANEEITYMDERTARANQFLGNSKNEFPQK